MCASTATTCPRSVTGNGKAAPAAYSYRVIIGPLGTGPLPSRPQTAGASDPPVEDRPLLGRVLSWDKGRGLQEFDRALEKREFEPIASMAGSSQLKVKELLQERADKLWNLDLSTLAPREREHVGKLYTEMTNHVDPPDSGTWFLQQFGPALDGQPDAITFAATHKVQPHLSAEENAVVAHGMLERFPAPGRLAWPRIYALEAAVDSGWEPTAEETQTIRARLSANLAENEPLVSVERTPLQTENAILMGLLEKLPERLGCERVLLDRLLASPERGMYDVEGAPNRKTAHDCTRFGRVIARDPQLMAELMDELAAGSPRQKDLYMLLAQHGNALELTRRAKLPEGAPFERIHLHVVDRASRDLKTELATLPPAEGLRAARDYRRLWEVLSDDQLLLSNMTRLQIPENVGRLALDSDFLIAAVASRTSPELEKELLEKVPGLSFDFDSAEALELARLQRLLYSHQLGQVPDEPKALLAFYAAQKDPSPDNRIEWTKRWDAPHDGILHRLRVDPSTAGVLLERGQVAADLAASSQALTKVESDEVKSLLASGELNVFNRLLEAGTPQEARSALDVYRGARAAGLDEEGAFRQAAGGLLGAPATSGGGLAVNAGGLVVGGAFLRKRA